MKARIFAEENKKWWTLGAVAFGLFMIMLDNTIVNVALMNPATLSIITATFPPKERGQAIGIWAGVSALALAIGPLLGGLIVDNINWHWIFYVNVPVGVVGILVSRWVIAESRDTSREQSIDLPGLVTSGG